MAKKKEEIIISVRFIAPNLNRLVSFGVDEDETDVLRAVLPLFQGEFNTALINPRLSFVMTNVFLVEADSALPLPK